MEFKIGQKIKLPDKIDLKRYNYFGNMKSALGKIGIITLITDSDLNIEFEGESWYWGKDNWNKTDFEIQKEGREKRVKSKSNKDLFGV